MTPTRALIETAWVLAGHCPAAYDLGSLEINAGLAGDNHDWRDALVAALEAESVWSDGTRGLDAEGVVIIDDEQIYWADNNAYTQWQRLADCDTDVIDAVTATMDAKTTA